MSIGTDPEFFIRDKKSGKFLNAETMFPGTKEAPHMMKSGAGLQTDNVCVEFASPVAKDGKDMVDKLQAVFGELINMLPKGTDLDVSPSAEFDDDQLQSDQSQLFGCSVSYNAWVLGENEPADASATNLRSCGGHIHIGKNENDGNDFLLEPFGKVDVVKMCDTFHGIISVILDNSEASVERRKIYGKAGDHRPTNYGVEYRTLSSFWLKSPNLVMLIDSLTQDVLKIIREGKHNEIINAISEDKIQMVINTGDVKTAEKILNNFLLEHLSVDTKYYLDECLKNSNKYNFKKEWSLAV